MKIDVDFDELMQTALNGSIEASEKLADKSPDAAGYAEQFERIAKISAGVTVGILREYHAALEIALDAIPTTR